MTVSIATLADLPQLVEFSRKLHSQTGYTKFAFAADKVAKAFSDTITGDPKQGIVLVARKEGRGVGVIGGTIIEPHYSHDKIAAEWIWWTNPDQSPRLLFTLLEGFEYWAKHVAGCKAVMIGRLQDKNTSFRKRGYTPTETTLIKEL